MKMNIKMNTSKYQFRFWVVLGVIAVVYNVIAFVLPFPKNAVFIISYLFTMIAIAAQIYVIRTAFFQGEGIKSKFYGFPIAKLGVMYLAVQLILGFLFMALGAVVPLWLPVVLYILLLGASVIGLIAADAVREEVERQDAGTTKQVNRMRNFQARTRMITEQNQMPEAGGELKKLADAFRFSDPVSSRETEELEEQIAKDLAKLQDAAALLKKEEVTELCRRISAELAERNELCRLQKNR